MNNIEHTAKQFLKLKSRLSSIFMSIVAAIPAKITRLDKEKSFGGFNIVMFAEFPVFL